MAVLLGCPRWPTVRTSARMQMPVEDLASSFVSASEPPQYLGLTLPTLASYRQLPPAKSRDLLILQQTLALQEVGNKPRE